MARVLVHGTETGYCAMGCRCDECREAHTWRERQRRRARGAKTQVHRPCGTYAAYKRHLRRREAPCDLCREENAARSAQYRALTCDAKVG